MTTKWSPPTSTSAARAPAAVAAATAAGAHAELVEVPGDHFVVIDPAHDAWRRTVEILDTIG